MRYSKKIGLLVIVTILLVSILSACSMLTPQDVKTDYTKYHAIFEVDGTQYAAVKFLRSKQENIVMPAAPIKDGYDFIGWYYKGTNNKFTETEFNSLKTSIFDTVNSVYLEAKFVKGKFTITFDSIYDDIPDTTFLIDTNVEFNGITKPANPVHDPCTFLGWYEDKEYLKEFDFTVNPHKSMTVYAKWDIPTYTITFDIESCGNISPIVALYDSEITAPTLEKRVGVVFKRFYVLDGVNKVTFEFNKMPKDGAKVYAEWITSSTINYMFGDKVLYQINDYPIGNTLTLENVEPGTVCYQPDYFFKGWCLDNQLKNKIVNSEIVIEDAVINLYGDFKNRSFLDQIDLFTNHGNSKSDSITINNNQELINAIDYVLTFNHTSKTPKYFKLNELPNYYVENDVKAIVNKAYGQITSVNKGIGYGYYQDNSKIIYLYQNEENLDVTIQTKDPIRYAQLQPGLVSVNNNKRPETFDNFKYMEYPLYNKDISTSNQLFYVLQYGYQPKCVVGSVAERMLNSAKAALKESVNDKMDDFDKVYAIYCWLIMNVDYDNKALTNEQASADSNYNVKCEAWHLEGVFDRHLAVCDGISKAMVVLCRLEGIPCIRIAGPGHAWNKVYIDADGLGSGVPAWYSIDATWGDLTLSDLNKTALDLDSFLQQDSEKINNGGTLYNCSNHKDIVANTSINVYQMINFADGPVNDLYIENKNDTIALANYIKSLGIGDQSISIRVSDSYKSSFSHDLSKQLSCRIYGSGNNLIIIA